MTQKKLHAATPRIPPPIPSIYNHTQFSLQEDILKINILLSAHN